MYVILWTFYIFFIFTIIKFINVPKRLTWGHARLKKYIGFINKDQIKIIIIHIVLALSKECIKIVIFGVRFFLILIRVRVYGRNLAIINSIH